MISIGFFMPELSCARHGLDNACTRLFIKSFTPPHIRSRLSLPISPTLVPSSIERLGLVSLVQMAQTIHNLNDRVARSSFGRYFLLEGSGHPNERKGARFTTELRGGLTTFSSMVHPSWPLSSRNSINVPAVF